MADKKPTEGEKKSSKKVILLALLLFLIVGAGAAAGYYFFIHQAADSERQQGNKESRDSKKTQESQSTQKDTGNETYYDLTSPLIVNFPPGSSARIVKIAVSVLLKDEASVEVLKKHEPMIRNNLLMAISSMGADQMKTFDGKQELRKMMLTEIGKVMEKMAGKNTAKDLFFTEFVMQ